MDPVNIDDAATNYDDRELCCPVNQSSENPDVIEADQNEYADDEIKKLAMDYEKASAHKMEILLQLNESKKLAMDYEKASARKKEILLQLKATFEKCFKHIEEQEKTQEETKEGIEKLLNRIDFRSPDANREGKNVELNYGVFAACKEIENDITELIYKEKHSWEEQLKKYKIREQKYIESFLESEKQESIDEALIVAYKNQLLHLEYEEEILHDGDLPPAIMTVGNDSPSTAESCKEVCQELDEMKISGD